MNVINLRLDIHKRLLLGLKSYDENNSWGLKLKMFFSKQI